MRNKEKNLGSNKDRVLNPKDVGVKSCLLTWDKFIGLVSGDCLVE